MNEILRQASIEVVVPFHDLDPMNVAWHGNYLKYFELARCELLESFDYNYPQMEASGYLWPIVDLRVKYVQPARFEQRLVVTAKLVEVVNRMRIDYEIRCAQSGKRLTRGHSIQVAVDKASGEMQFVSPPALLERLGVTP
ncbi:thioesterase family protein [Gallaecimonas sp. GXIMD4217]|uniref:acyl-CoA thioesterase n=1 Tax=Gallaecimonas sp. GXIMD4217 TaxID=3131927 RepID=UPI00311B35CD